MTGRTHELKVDKTTIGRVEDNAFQIPEPSVSSHHCAVLLRGNDIIVKDLNSTNGTYINSERCEPSRVVALKAGDTIRLGQTDLTVAFEPHAAPAPGAAEEPPQ